MQEKFYVTTPIYYINDRPHIGHAYTTVAADTLARYRRLRGDEVIFLTGTDENSQKTVEAAAKSGESLEIYTSRLAALWKETWANLGISNTDFIRTTEERHKKTVYEIWRRVEARGDIYKGKYEGLYCVGHEAFLKPGDLVDGLCPDHQKLPEHIVEENYFFGLSKYQKELLDFYDAHPEFVVPSARFHEVRKFVETGLEDISISRPMKKWGIPVPGDPAAAIYVWFDALLNYVSAVGVNAWEAHPADIHAVGKDIIRFHAIIWPAILLSAGLPLPKKILTNGFFTINGVKISKSLGNAIDPAGLTKTYGNDALRYFLLREIPYGEDGDFSEKKLKERYNSDLANGLGNFAARVIALAVQARINAGLNAPACRQAGIDADVDSQIKLTKETVSQKLAEFKFNEALAAIWDLIAFGDAYVNETKPWEKGLIANRKSQAVFNLIVVLDNVAALLAPFLPDTAEKISKSIVWEGDVLKIKKGEVLFPRIG